MVFFQVTIIDTQFPAVVMGGFVRMCHFSGLMAAVGKLGLSRQFMALLFHLNSIFLSYEPTSGAGRLEKLFQEKAVV